MTTLHDIRAAIRDMTRSQLVQAERDVRRTMQREARDFADVIGFGLVLEEISLEIGFIDRGYRDDVPGAAPSSIDQLTDDELLAELGA